MLEALLARRGTSEKFPRILHRICNDLFAIAQYWLPSVEGAEKGREFERILYTYCEKYGLPITERAGSRTVRGVRAASGFLHESDAVLSFPDATIHFELKHLLAEVTKNDVLIFNQKGLDFLLADDHIVRVRLFFVDGPRGFCQRHGKSYLTRRRRGGEGGGGGLLTGRAIPSAYRWAWCPAGTPVSWKSQYASRSRLAS